MKPEDRERATIEVAERVVAQKLAGAERGGTSAEQWIHDTVYHELRRLGVGGDGADGRARSGSSGAEAAYWLCVRRRALAASDTESRAILRELVDRFVNEIVGNFNPLVYKAATSIVPIALSGLLNALSPWRLLRSLPALPSLKTNVSLRGEVDHIRKLDQLGTIILTPTHSSNLDSPVIGWTIYRLGLPPYIYGAGLNLFTNPVLSFFMHNLGAYKVDRKKTAALYKDTLKEYATVTLELGYDNLFFPGGTRSRSGTLESKLKLGLLGCGIRAYVMNLMRRAEKPNIYVIPCTISYGLVLEAETLVTDFLRETGRSRYIIEDDESSRATRILNFLTGLISLDSHVYVTFSEALDPFGNRVGEDGRSYDRRGRPIDITRYVTDAEGRPVHDGQRDAEYTRELGDAVADAFRRDNTLQSTHLVAFAMFELLERANPELDLYRLLRTGGRRDNVPIGELAAAVGAVVAAVKERSERRELRLDPKLRGLDAEDIVADALKHFGTYHTDPVLQRRGDRVYAGDRNLLYYYHNRPTGYGLEKLIGGIPPSYPPGISPLVAAR